MKRYEMVLRIAECLVEPHFSEDPMKEADYILKSLERKGMLPPPRYIEPVHGQGEYINEWD